MFVLVLSTFCVLTITQLEIRVCRRRENVDAVWKTVGGFVVAIIVFNAQSCDTAQVVAMMDQAQAVNLDHGMRNDLVQHTASAQDVSCSGRWHANYETPALFSTESSQPHSSVVEPSNNPKKAL